MASGNYLYGRKAIEYPGTSIPGGTAMRLQCFYFLKKYSLGYYKNPFIFPYVFSPV